MGVWLGDCRIRVLENVASFIGQAVMLTVTAPGAQVGGLPWDESVCSWRGPHRHSGPAGCRCIDGQALGFNRTAGKRMSRLHQAARQRVYRRHGAGALRRLALAPEPQHRGVIHWHVVVGYSNARERAAAHYYRDCLEELAPAYWWGNVGRQLKPQAAVQAAVYVSKYLAKSAGTLVGLEALVMRGHAPTRTIGICPRQLERTRCTASVLRFRRQVFAHNGMRYDCRTLWAFRRHLAENGWRLPNSTRAVLSRGAAPRGPTAAGAGPWP